MRDLFLEERVAKLERSAAHPAYDGAMEILRGRIASLERAVYNCTPDALKEPITAKDVDRWRAIEKAAQRVSSAYTTVMTASEWAAAKDELRAALMGLRS